MYLEVFRGMEAFMQIENKLISSARQCFIWAPGEERIHDTVRIKDEDIPQSP